MPAWMVLQNPDSNYDDVEAVCYEYPRKIPNGTRISEGDYLICTLSKKKSKDGKRIMGMGWINHIRESTVDGKVMRKAFYGWYYEFPEPLTFEFIGGDPRNNIYNAMNPIPENRFDEVIKILTSEIPAEEEVSTKEQKVVQEEENLQEESTKIPVDLTGPGPFGRWLAAELNSKNMNSWDLAQSSDIPEEHIEQIIRGEIRHPMPAVMKSIQESIDEKLDAETIEAIREDSEIEGFGEFVDFDPHGDKSRWPTGGGVYVFYDVSSRPVYVGETGDLHRRMKDYFSPHRRMWWVSQPIVETASFIPVEDTKARKRLEKILIRFLKSNAVMNRIHVRR
jgi:hypothetical protein